MSTKILCIGSVNNVRAMQNIALYNASIFFADDLDDGLQMFGNIKPTIVLLDSSLKEHATHEVFADCDIYLICNPTFSDITNFMANGFKKLVANTSKSDAIAKTLGLYSYPKAINIEDFLKNLTILYVEDDLTIVEAMKKVMLRFSSNIIFRHNGKEAIEAFLEFKPDIIISDIQMPEMDGLSAAKIIRQLDFRMPIILTTAHSDDEYFQTSIETKIDRYIVKPLDITRLKDALTDVATSIRERDIAINYHKKLVQKELKSVSDELVREMIDVNPDPIFVIHDGKVAYSNVAFDKMINGDILKRLQNGQSSIEDLFLKLDGYMKKCSDYPKLNKVAIKTLKGKHRFFNISFNPITTYMHGSMVILRDITLLEYQKSKYENASVMLNDLLAKLADSSKKQDELPVTFESLSQINTNKLSAHEYESDNSISSEELAELKEYEDDIFDQLEFTDNSISYYRIGNLFDRYSRTLHKFIEFNDMTEAISTLAGMLIELKDLKPEACEKLRFYVYNIVCDLSNWREHVFILQDAIDIHYLDASLLSNCLQAKFAVTGFDDTTDNFELF